MMEKKLKGGVKGQPHWLVERDVRRRTSLPQNGGVKGGGTKLGGAEKLLCTRFARMAQQGMPYLTDEVDEIVRDTCIELGLSDHLGQPYHADSNVSKLAQNFIRRCEEDGIPLVCKNGTKLAKIRADSAHIEALVAARDNAIRHPENGLLKFQKDRKIKLTLLNVFSVCLPSLRHWVSGGTSALGMRHRSTCAILPPLECSLCLMDGRTT